jgi:hypothetical protein
LKTALSRFQESRTTIKRASSGALVAVDRISGQIQEGGSSVDDSRDRMGGRDHKIYKMKSTVPIYILGALMGNPSITPAKIIIFYESDGW